MADPVVHFEVNGPDPQTSKFYAELFGWHMQSFDMPTGPYEVIDTHAGKGINGGMAHTAQGNQPAYVTFYAEVSDLQGTLDKAESLGGKTAVPVTEVPGIVTFAMLADPEGNVVGLVGPPDPAQPQPGVSAGDNPPVNWFEVLGNDPKGLWDFYSELFGWTIKDVSSEAFVYGQVEASDRGIPGGIGAPPDGQPRVNLYAEVDDLQKYLDRAEALGGTTLVPPTQADPNTKVAILQDPQGTRFGLWASTATG